MKTKYLQRPFQVKDMGDGDGTFSGYGSVFGELDSYRDVIVAGAFTKSLADHAAKGRKVPMLYQHHSHEPIGVYTSIKEDAHGLMVEGQINMEVQKGRECFSLLKQGALSGLSIGYETITERWDEKNIVRTLLEVKLWEVSPVTFPAGDSARVVSVKSIENLASLSDCEAILRDVGFSKSETLAFVSRIKAIPMRSESANAEAESFKRALQILQSA